MADQTKPEAAPRLSVKPLVWSGDASAWCEALPSEAWGYEIAGQRDEWILRRFGERRFLDSRIIEIFPTREAAMAAAEAHHEAAVRDLFAKLCDLGGAAP